MKPKLAGIELFEGFDIDLIYSVLAEMLKTNKFSISEVAQAIQDGNNCNKHSCGDYCKMDKLRCKLRRELKQAGFDLGDVWLCPTFNCMLTCYFLNGEAAVEKALKTATTSSREVKCKACKNFRGVLGCKLIGCKLHGSWTPTKDDYCSKFEALDE